MESDALLQSILHSTRIARERGQKQLHGHQLPAAGPRGNFRSSRAQNASACNQHDHAPVNTHSAILVTGGAGFIGSAVVRRLIRESGAFVTVVDSLTYAGNLESLAEVDQHPRFRFEQVDICDAGELGRVFALSQPDAVIHLAAESHVDRSIDDAGVFVRTNVMGTYTLLVEARRYWQQLPHDGRSRFRFLHVSTDEVFGSLGESEYAREDTPYEPNSPYSATKAGSDHLVRAWHHTYGLPTITTNCCNNYGPHQFPEKLIPLVILCALEGRPIPVYGTGKNVRDWMHVDDTAEALQTVLREAEPGHSYCIGGYDEHSNLSVVREVCGILNHLLPDPSGPYERLITFVQDRPGHDMRYAVDGSRIEREIGWAPRRSFAEGLRSTVVWYLENREWWQRVLSGAYRGERLGLASFETETDAR